MHLIKRIHTTTTTMYNTKVQQQVSAQRAKVRIALTKAEGKAFVTALQMWQQHEKARKVSAKIRIETEKARKTTEKNRLKEEKAMAKEKRQQIRDAKEKELREKKVAKKVKRRAQRSQGTIKAMKSLKKLFV